MEYQLVRGQVMLVTSKEQHKLWSLAQLAATVWYSDDVKTFEERVNQEMWAAGTIRLWLSIAQHVPK